jgi:hypothetical protein
VTVVSLAHSAHLEGRQHSIRRANYSLRPRVCKCSVRTPQQHNHRHARARKHRSGVMVGARRTGKSPQFSLHRAHSLQQQRGLTLGVRRCACSRQHPLNIQNERQVHNASIWCRCVVSGHVRQGCPRGDVCDANDRAVLCSRYGHRSGQPWPPWSSHRVCVREPHNSAKKNAVLARVKSCTHTSS